MIDGHEEFVMIDDQKIIYEKAKQLIAQATKENKKVVFDIKIPTLKIIVFAMCLKRNKAIKFDVNTYIGNQLNVI